MEAITTFQILSSFSGSVVGVILFVFFIIWYELFFKRIFRQYPQASISRTYFMLFLRSLKRLHRIAFLIELQLSFVRLPAPFSYISPRMHYNLWKLYSIVKYPDAIIDDYIARRIVYLMNKYNEAQLN